MEELTSNNFNDTIKEGKTIVDFWAPWCGPCKMFAPIFEETAGEVEGITFAKVNTEDNPQIAQDAGIRAIPTLVFYENGEEVNRISGAMQKEMFKQKINEIFG